MEAGSQSRDSSSGFASRSLRVVAALALIALHSAHSRLLAAGNQETARPQGGPPDVQITQVRSLDSPIAGANKAVEIRWTARVPQLTTIVAFDVVLKVRYSDGSRSTVRREQLKPSTRTTILEVSANRRSVAVLKDYRASVKARFSTASTLTVRQLVSAGHGEDARGVAGSSSAHQPEVFITAAKLADQGCTPGRRCVDVKWTADVPRNITINEFTVSVDALQENGASVRDSKTVGGVDRQVRLQPGPINSKITSIKVSLLTTFSSSDFKTMVKEGAFQ